MKTSNNPIAIAIACLLGACLFASAAVAQETATAKQEKANAKLIAGMSLPSAVQKMVREQSKGAMILEIAREIVNWKTVYEVAMKVNGRSKDLTIATNGSVLTTKNEVDVAMLPEPVKATIEKNVGKGKLLIVQSVTEGDTLAAYEAHVKTGKKLIEIRVGTDGQFLESKDDQDE